MKRLRAFLAICLCVAMTMSTLAGCGTKTTTDNTSAAETSKSTEASAAQTTAADKETESDSAEGITYPLDTDVTFRIYVQGGINLPSAYTDWEDVPFTKGLEEKWGVDIIWECAPAGADNTASYNLMLQDEDLPQIVWGKKCATSNIEQLIDDGVAMDISGYLEEYAPDYWAYMHNPDDEYRVKDLALATTKYGLTHFIGPRDTPENGTWAGVAVRKDWLDVLGLDIPTTLEEVDTVARAFYEEYGAVVTGAYSYYNNCHFMADGVGAMASFKWNAYVEDGEIKCANIEPEWKDYLEFMHQWYVDGILDQNFSGVGVSAMDQMVNEGNTGLVCTAATRIPVHNATAEELNNGAVWVAIPPTVQNEGDVARASHATYSAWAGEAGSFITTNCTEEQLIEALEILNWGYTEEGMIYWNYGEEGVSFEYDENGVPHFTDLIRNNELGITQARYTYTGAGGNTLASAQLWDMLVDVYGEELKEATETFRYNSVASDYRVPTLTYSDEVSSTYNDLNNAISTYFEEMALKFVTGEESLDNFDDYVATLKGMGLDTLMEIMNDAYDDFVERAGLE